MSTKAANAVRLADCPTVSLRREAERIQPFLKGDATGHLKAHYHIITAEIARREALTKEDVKVVLQDTFNWMTSQGLPVPVELSKRIAVALGHEMTTLGVVLARQQEMEVDPAKLAEPQKCGFIKAWVGKCEEPVCAPHSRCKEHSTVRCCVCGAQASHECDHTGQFVCGYPLCDDCEGHTDPTKDPGTWGTMNHTHRAKITIEKPIP